MKHFFTLSFIFLFSSSYLGAQCVGTYCLSGNTTNARSSEIYSISSPAALGQVVIQSVTGVFIDSHEVLQSSDPSVSLVQVNFSQAECTTRTSFATFSFSVGGSFPTTLTAAINIQPRRALGALQNISSGHSGTEFYTFITRAENASSYSWTVYGGTISGSRTGRIIKVRPNAGTCSISVTARASNNCGTTPLKSYIRHLGSPSYVSQIAGSTVVGSSFGDYSTYSASVLFDSPIVDYVWSLSGPFRGGTNGNPNFNVYVNTSSGFGSGTLYVYAENSCGRTNVKSKYITIGNTYGSSASSSSAWKDVKKTVVANDNGGNLKLIVPNFKDKSLKIYIYSIRGEMIEQLAPKSFEISLNQSKYKNGIYIVKTVGTSENSSTKFTVNQ